MYDNTTISRLVYVPIDNADKVKIGLVPALVKQMVKQVGNIDFSPFLKEIISTHSYIGSRHYPIPLCRHTRIVIAN